jgi:hypothetical protein
LIQPRCQPVISYIAPAQHFLIAFTPLGGVNIDLIDIAVTGPQQRIVQGTTPPPSPLIVLVIV